MGGYDITPTMKDVQKKFSVRYYLNLVLLDEEERRYFKQQVRLFIRMGFEFLVVCSRKSCSGENKNRSKIERNKPPSNTCISNPRIDLEITVLMARMNPHHRRAAKRTLWLIICNPMPSDMLLAFSFLFILTLRMISFDCDLVDKTVFWLSFEYECNLLFLSFLDRWWRRSFLADYVSIVKRRIYASRIVSDVRTSSASIIWFNIDEN